MKEEEKNSKKNYKSPFKSLKIDESGQMAIGIVQSNFDNFWRQLKKIDGTKHAKLECLNKLREACHWMNRSVAEYHEIEVKEKDED